MKKLLLILLCLPMIGFGQLGPYYKGNGHPKAKGLNFQIKTPLGFEQMEADRPNIVQKWIKNPKDNNTMVTVVVLVKSLPKEAIQSKEYWKEYLKNQEGVDDICAVLKESRDISNAKYFVIDNYSGFYYETYETQDVTPYGAGTVTFTIHQLSIQIFVEEHWFILQMMSMDRKLLKANERLFYSLASSVVFPDQYGN